MSRLKIIEATYYNPSSIAGGINVTKDLIQIIDFDNDNLIYNGFYNDIFSDPAKGVKKRLKIILEYKNQKYIHVYKENDPINLPDDLKMRTINNPEAEIRKQSKNFMKNLYDLLIIGPTIAGLGIDIKKLISKIALRPYLLIKILIGIIVLLLIIMSSVWWFSPLTKFLKDAQSRFLIDYNDPSKILDISIFEILDKVNKLSTDEEKQKLIESYSGFRTDRERGYVNSISTSSKSVVLADISSLICSFDKKWERKLLILERKDIQFVGVIDSYNIEKKKVLLLYCSLLY